MSSASASPSPSSAAPPQGSSSTSQGNLYLFTFLSTLLVLLLISCSIVFRSFILRRRYQRRLAEALATGAILAPRTQGSRRKRFRTRPKFFDTWLSEAGSSVTWSDLMPVSVLPIKGKKKAKETVESEKPEDPRTEAVLHRIFTAHFLQPDRNSNNSRLRRRSNPDADSVPSSPVSPTTPTPVQEKPDPISDASPTQSRKNVVQVAVLIAMPSPRNLNQSPIQPQQHEDEIPEVAFGVTRLHYKVKEVDS
ncbi:hypothetical protein GYMLUDRAFT_33963 [Collybiopsis luxurians FD-317 M1]|nr:hypothetical protein GYMLUDRAFT_33963 [Collybiopsis luxurians FD-317 M1]